MKISGIYRIQSICKPDRCYIGSAVNVSSRWKLHLRQLQTKKHHSIKLQRHFDKYGESDLVFIIIEPCLPTFLTVREDTYLHPIKPYFNICPNAGSPLGVKRSDETRKKLSDYFTGKITWMGGNKHTLGFKHSEETKAKRRKPRSEDTKQKMRLAWKKRGPVSDKAKINMSKAWEKRREEHPDTSETRQKKSESMKGVNTWMKGRKIPPETIKKRTESLKRNRLLKLNKSA